MVWEAEVNELQASYVSLEADVDAHGRLIRPTSDQAFDAHIWCSAWQLVCFPTGWGWCWAVEEPDCWADSPGTDHDACRIIQTLLSLQTISNVIFDHPLWSIATLAARSEISVWQTWSRSFCETSVRAALLCASQRLCSFIVPCTESVPCQVAGSLGLRGHSEVSIRAPGIERSGLCLDNSWYSWRIVWNSAAPCLLLR